MRVGLGLVSLLVTLGICMMFFKTVEAPQIEVGQKAQQQAQQISGRGVNGEPAMNSYKAEEYDVGSQFRGVRITSVDPDGPMATYGLKPDDVVLQIKGLDLVTFGNYEMAKAELDEAYQNAAPLLVQRGTDKVELKTTSPLAPLISGQ